MMKSLRMGLLALACLAIGQTVAFAQNGSIAGVVRDTSGGVMPGVTVEASSPALIEKTRTAVHRLRRPIQHHRPASRHLHRHVHADRLQHGQARGDRTDRRVHGDGQRGAQGRRSRGDDHGFGAEPAHRHPERSAAQVTHQRHDRRAADGPQFPERSASSCRACSFRSRTRTSAGQRWRALPDACRCTAAEATRCLW